MPPHDPPLPQDVFRGWNFWQDITISGSDPNGDTPGEVPPSPEQEPSEVDDFAFAMSMWQFTQGRTAAKENA